MIVTFLALLEMIRLKLIRVFQAGPAGPIRIYKRARPKDAPHPIHDPEDEYKAHHPEQQVHGEPQRQRPKDHEERRMPPKRQRTRQARRWKAASNERRERTRQHRGQRAADTEHASEEAMPRLDSAQLKAIVEALVFASPEPLTLKMLQKLLSDEPKEDVVAAVSALQQDYASVAEYIWRDCRRIPDHDAAGVS